MPASPGYTLITANAINDGSGRPLALGRVVCSGPVNDRGQAVSATCGAPGGGPITSTPVTFMVVAGNLTTDLYGNTPQLADTNLGNPQNFGYTVQIIDSSTGSQLQGPIGYLCVQPRGATWSFDTYNPVQPSLVTLQDGPTGLSNYELAQLDGFTGTLNDYLNSIVGGNVTVSGTASANTISTVIHNQGCPSPAIELVADDSQGPILAAHTLKFPDNNTATFIPLFSGPFKCVATYRAPVATVFVRGPLHYWKTNEGAGSVFNDSGLSPAPMSATVAPTWQQSGFGFTSPFPQWPGGCNPQTSVPWNGDTNAPFSILGWLDAALDGVQFTILLANSSSSGAGLRGFALGIAGSNDGHGGLLQMQLVNDGNNNKAVVVKAIGTVIPSNGTQQFAMVYDGSGTPAGITLYVNGAPVNTTTLVDSLKNPDGSLLSISCANNITMGQYLDGNCRVIGTEARVKFYDYAVLNSQVTDHYAGGPQ